MRVNADAYVTIVDVDSEGGVNLLFPNSYQQASFYGDGLVKANEAVLIPDSLQPGNRAGFYWDYSPPKGIDTIRVFTSTDLQTAQMIRQRVQSLQPNSSQTRGGVTTRAVTATVKTLRDGLATRGIITVADSTSHIPGLVGSVASETGTGTGPVPPALATSPAGEPPLAAAHATSAPVGISTAVTAPADWAATSVTVLISD